MLPLSDDDTPTLPLHACRPADLPAFLAGLPPATAAFLQAQGCDAAAGKHWLLPGPDGLSGALLGLGEADPADPVRYGDLATTLPAGSAWQLANRTHAEAATLGWCLGAYRYAAFKPPTRAPARLRADPNGAAATTAAAIWRVRDLINAPANVLGPAELADAVAILAEAHGARCTVLDGDAVAEGFPALHAVGAGSPRGPRVAMLEWGGDGPLVALCGKGVCFDTGGLDLKPSAAMLRMKKDMAGAAILMGVAELIMRANLPVRLLLLVGAVENSVSGTAFRPRDVLRTRAGLTVEIGNTDAEGRLVLADLLTCAAERGPDLLIDAATLTGAARVALGPDLPGLFTAQDRLADVLLAAGRDTHDPLWRLPIHDGYKSWLDSLVADVDNVAARPMAGAIVAALFLRRFVPLGTEWAHLDVYGWNDGARPGRPEGGEAQALRALTVGITRWAADRARSP